MGIGAKAIDTEGWERGGHTRGRPSSGVENGEEIRVPGGRELEEKGG